MKPGAKDAHGHAQEHLALAKHLTAEVKSEEFVAGKGVITKWDRIRRQNHWFDALYNACVAGHGRGVRQVEEQAVTPVAPAAREDPRDNWVNSYGMNLRADVPSSGMRGDTGAQPDPHAQQQVRSVGPSPEQADATLVLLHGRGATADSILALHAELELPSLAAVAPQAEGHTWYPYSFLASIEENQPFLDSALRRVESLVTDLLARGVASQKIALLGFSQGACLACESVARHPRRYGAIIAFTGGLIGPPGTPRNYAGSLAGTPIFLGTGDPDPHVPFERVQETARVFERMGGNVELRRYSGMSHSINEEELAAARSLLQNISSDR